MDRTAIIRGAGIVTREFTFRPRQPIEAVIDLQTFDIDTDDDGVIDTRLDDAIGRVNFTPVGDLNDGSILEALYPHKNPVPGTSLCGTADVPTVCHSQAGRKVTFHNTFIEKMPDLILSAKSQVFGQATIAAVRKKNTSPEDANSLYTEASAAFTPASLLSETVRTEAFAAAFGTTFTNILTKDGWKISFQVQVAYEQVDDDGTVDAYMRGVSVMAKCRPVNLTEAQILGALRVQGAARGSSMRSGDPLVIQSAGLTFTLNDAQLREGPLRWGALELRAGEIGFYGHRAEDAGAYGELFSFE